MELVDVPDSKSGGETRVGSSPTLGTSISVVEAQGVRKEPEILNLSLVE